jgi:hypothetical protein
MEALLIQQPLGPCMRNFRHLTQHTLVDIIAPRRSIDITAPSPSHALSPCSTRRQRIYMLGCTITTISRVSPTDTSSTPTRNISDPAHSKIHRFTRNLSRSLS